MFNYRHDNNVFHWSMGRKRKLRVLSLCDFTGNMLKPWAEAGHDCLALDIQHSIRKGEEGRLVDGIRFRWADIRTLTPDDLPPPDIIFAFPPCQNLALSGSSDFKRKGIQGLIDGLSLVESCRKLCQWYGVPWMLENPMSRLSTCWRKPDHKFAPWQYGETYQKQTWLWTGGGFIMPEPEVEDKPEYVTERILDLSPGPQRKMLRSATPLGFARAVYQSNRFLENMVAA